MVVVVVGAVVVVVVVVVLPLLLLLVVVVQGASNIGALSSVLFQIEGHKGNDCAYRTNGHTLSGKILLQGMLHNFPHGFSGYGSGVRRQNMAFCALMLIPSLCCGR